LFTPPAPGAVVLRSPQRSVQGARWPSRRAGAWRAQVLRRVPSAPQWTLVARRRQPVR